MNYNLTELHKFNAAAKNILNFSEEVAAEYVNAALENVIKSYPKLSELTDLPLIDLLAFCVLEKEVAETKTQLVDRLHGWIVKRIGEALNTDGWRMNYADKSFRRTLHYIDVEVKAVIFPLKECCRLEVRAGEETNHTEIPMSDFTKSSSGIVECVRINMLRLLSTMYNDDDTGQLADEGFGLVDKYSLVRVIEKDNFIITQELDLRRQKLSITAHYGSLQVTKWYNLKDLRVGLDTVSEKATVWQEEARKECCDKQEVVFVPWV